jgi:hypothetical protein
MALSGLRPAGFSHKMVTFELSEPLNAGLSDFQLRNLDSGATIDLTSRLVEAVGNQQTVHLDRYGLNTGAQLFLADGNYELTLLGSKSEKPSRTSSAGADARPGIGTKQP